MNKFLAKTAATYRLNYGPSYYLVSALVLTTLGASLLAIGVYLVKGDYWTATPLGVVIALFVIIQVYINGHFTCQCWMCERYTIHGYRVTIRPHVQLLSQPMQTKRGMCRECLIKLHQLTDADVTVEPRNV